MTRRQEKFLNPAQVCKILDITPANITRLIKEKYLNVKSEINFKNGNMLLFSAEEVQSIAPLMPRIRQAWEQYDNYYYGAKQLSKTRVNRRQSYHNKVEFKKEFLENIAAFSEKREKVLRASYYLYHLNHYAKKGSPYLYDLKETVLHTFVQNYYDPESNFLEIYFIEGGNKITLCQECKARAKNQKISYPRYIDRTGGCPKCSREYNYYSLYEFIINDGDYRFCFHTPFSTAKKWFKKLNLFPPEKEIFHQEQAYAYGRPVFESEALAVELIEVIEELQDFLAGFGVEALFDTYTRVE